MSKWIWLSKEKVWFKPRSFEMQHTWVNDKCVRSYLINVELEREVEELPE